MDLSNTRANKFDWLVGEISIQRILLDCQDLLPNLDNALDIGCGLGHLTGYLTSLFDNVVGIDCSQTNLDRAIQKTKSPNCHYVLEDAEAFNLDTKFSAIFLLNILEHVNNPVKVLNLAKSHLQKGGMIFIQVPNARSVNRQIGLLMGLIGSLDELSQEEISFFGHQRVYDTVLLNEHIHQAGLGIVKEQGIVLKPFTNQQMWSICEDHDTLWQELFVSALYRLGLDNPKQCTSLYVIATDLA